MKLEHHLLAPVPFIDEHRVGVRRFIEGQLVGDDEAGIYLAALDAIEQRAQVALDVALPRLDGQKSAPM